MHVDCRRQPATVWHDPKVPETARCHSSPSLNAHTDASVPTSYTPVTSPVADRRPSQVRGSSVNNQKFVSKPGPANSDK